jgi:hypothetical protein
MIAAQAKKSRSIYGVHPGLEMVQKWIAELKPKTGRSLDEWIALAKKEGPANEKDRREWLKISYKLGTNSAWWIAARGRKRIGRGLAREVSGSGTQIRRRAIFRGQRSAAAAL